MSEEYEYDEGEYEDEGIEGVAEETITLEYHFVGPERQAALDRVLRQLQEGTNLRFLLAILEVRINDRTLSPNHAPTRALLRKLLAAMGASGGEQMLFFSPYNNLGLHPEADEEPVVYPWDFDLADELHEFSDLRSLRVFLETGTAYSRGVGRQKAQELHDAFWQALTGGGENARVWGCLDIVMPGTPQPPKTGQSEGVWPADDVSDWFDGVFWDDCLFIINPQESTFSILALSDAD